MFAALGRFIYRRRWLVLAAGLIFIIISGVYGTSVFGVLKSGGFYDATSESYQASIGVQQHLNNGETPLLVLFTSPSMTVDDPAYAQAVGATLAKVQGHDGVGSITSFYTTGKTATTLVSNDHKSTYALVGLTGDEVSQKNTLDQLRPLLTSPQLQVRLGGAPPINEEVNAQVSKDLGTAESLTFPILAVLLILIFGSLVAAALPLAVGGLSILGAFLIVRIIAVFTDMSIFSINVITILGLGLAIDYSLFMVSRFREELSRQQGDVPAALTRTMQTAGRTVLFSGLTVAISLLSLKLFPLMMLQSMGMGGAAAAIVAVLAALTVLPALLAALGTRVNALSVQSLLPGRRKQAASTAATAAPANTGFWYRTSQLVMRRPVVVLVVTLIPMLLVGAPFLHVNLSTPDARSIPATHESRVVSDILTAQFPGNENIPIELLIHSDSDVLTASNLSKLYDYTRVLAAVPGVTRVDSLVTLDPRLDKAAYAAFYANRAQNPQAAQAAAQYANADYSEIKLIYNSDPHSATAQAIVQDVRALPQPAGMQVQVGGESALLSDLLSGLLGRAPYVFALIVVVIFVLLFLMLGSLVIPLKAVILNVLSLSVSFGALVWVFQDGHFADLLGFTTTGSIDATQPILIFAIAFGLSMDYEVFLLSRIKESFDRTGDNTASVALGVQKTGAIITSAAILLVIVIGSFITGEVVFIKEIGLGLGLAILVDATLVRMLLVPATMRLMGRYNWWAPAPLAALYRRMGMSEVEPVGEAAEPEVAAPKQPKLAELERQV